jgi:flagellar protein FlaG
MASIGAVRPAAAAGTANSKATGHPAGTGASAGTVSGATGASEAGAGGDPATAARIKAAVDVANQQLNQSNHELAFVFDDKLGRILVKIIDRQTNTVVRQVPSEEMLAAARALSGTPPRGALLKSKA